MTQKGGWRLVGGLARSLYCRAEKVSQKKSYFKRLKIIKIKIIIKHLKMFETGILPLKVRVVVGWGGFTAVTNSAS